ncbi:Ribonucleases P/MRP protein subunit POP1, partial [Stegodyphus mimosarum]
MSEEKRDIPFASKVNYEKIKLKFKKEQFYMSANTSNKVKMVLLKDTLVRYRIIGPMAQSIIINLLKVADVYMTSPYRNAENNENYSSCEEVSSSNDSDKSLFWWQTYYSSENLQSLHMKKKCLMEKLKHQITYVIPPRTVMGFTVRDPRINLSSKKFDLNHSSEATTDYNIQELDELFTPDIASSALWDEDIRHEVTATQISENDLNKEKQKCIVPNATFNLGEKESRIPIIMTQQPGHNGFGFGWDIILPQGWGMAFWMPLILNRARAAGLRDMSTINIESGQPSFPDSFPDSKSGSLFEEEIRKKCLIELYKLPKSKRPSFNKLGINTPFFLPYVTLVNDWEEKYIKKNASLKDSSLIQDTQKEIFVLRNSKLIGYLKNVCVNCNAKKQMKNLMDNFNIIVDFTLNPQNCLTRSLITVRVKCVYRGVPSKHSGIYLCDDLDIRLLKENQKYCGPVEPNCALNASNSENVEVHPSKEQISSKNENKKFHLERPEVNSVIFSCSRQKIGYISEGGFSNLSGSGCGIGHCSLIGLLSVLESCLIAKLRPTVLIREQHSFQYRMAFIDIM